MWDRLYLLGGGPAMFARTVDGGASWEPARAIFDPGVRAQTIGNLVVVLPGGALVDLATTIGAVAARPRATASIVALRSTDRGATWSPPVHVASQLAVGAADPDTGMAIRDGAILLGAAAGPGETVHVVWQDSRFTAGRATPSPTRAPPTAGSRGRRPSA